MSQTYISVELRHTVAEAARYRCGYCLSAQDVMGVKLHIEHILPLARGGQTIIDNLWLACPLCNAFKGTLVEAIDPSTNLNVSLYNPQTQNWREHFAWSDDGTLVIGQTPIGRATVLALRLNNDYLVPARRRWVAAGWHPPTV